MNAAEIAANSPRLDLPSEPSCKPRNRPMNDETLAALERAAARMEHGSLDGPDNADAALIRALIERERAGGERAQIVAWLHGYGARFLNGGTSCEAVAEAIEAGAHVTMNSVHLE